MLDLGLDGLMSLPVMVQMERLPIVCWWYQQQETSDSVVIFVYSCIWMLNSTCIQYAVQHVFLLAVCASIFIFFTRFTWYPFPGKIYSNIDAEQISPQKIYLHETQCFWTLQWYNERILQVPSCFCTRHESFEGPLGFIDSCHRPEFQDGGVPVLLKKWKIQIAMLGVNLPTIRTQWLYVRMIWTSFWKAK